MGTTSVTKPRVFVDADVLFAGSASPTEHGGSLVVLRMAEITLIDAYTSKQAISECERTLKTKMPDALHTFQFLLSRCLSVVKNPPAREVKAYKGKAHPEDLPLLVAAIQARCDWLVTFNSKHYLPGVDRVTVLSPGDLLRRVRSLLAGL